MAAAVFRLGRVEGSTVRRCRPISSPLRPARPARRRRQRRFDAREPGPVRRHGLALRRARPPRHLPRVALLNIEEEAEKGDTLSREAFVRLEGSDLNFVGNVEPHELASHPADVVVCDGFVGNVVLKLTEGLTSYIFRSIRGDLLRGPVAPIAVLALRPGIDRLRHRFDYEQFGGRRSSASVG